MVKNLVKTDPRYTLWQGGGGDGFGEIFSVQQLISCSDEADGCGGGNPVDGRLVGCGLGGVL